MSPCLWLRPRPNSSPPRRSDNAVQKISELRGHVKCMAEYQRVSIFDRGAPPLCRPPPTLNPVRRAAARHVIRLRDLRVVPSGLKEPQSPCFRAKRGSATSPTLEIAGVLERGAGLKTASGRGISADELPEATPVVPPKKTPKEPIDRHPQPKDAARKLQRQIVMLPPKKPPIPDSTEAVRPEGTEGQSAPAQSTPRWLPSRWPEAPPPGRFSR
jgi:hypothetical protein